MTSSDKILKEDEERTSKGLGQSPGPADAPEREGSWTAGDKSKPRATRNETDPKLVNPDATPGTGMLPDVGEGDDDDDMQPSS